MPAALGAQLEVQLFLGSSVSAPSPLSIEQRQQPALRFTAHFWGGYFLSGGHLMASATRRFPLTGRLFFSLDGRASASHLRLPVGNGHASVPNFALHFHAGLGYGPNPRPKKEPTR